MSTSAYANYSVTVASTGGRAVVAHYPIGDGYTTTKDFLNGYILKDMSLTGQPYPACWPHEEE